MRKIIILVVTILCVVMMSFSVFAHPGSLDDNGGHYDHSTGEYHYHHGYPAHSHEGGTCPYDFNDKTDRSYHKSNSQKESSSSKNAKYDVYVEKNEEKQKITIGDVFLIIVCIILSIPLLFIVANVIWILLCSIFEGIKSIIKKIRR